MTLTVQQLRDGVRAGNSQQETDILTRLLAVGSSVVVKHAPNAPDSVQNEAVVRMAGYLFDQPAASSRQGYASAFRNSGARALLLPWRVHGLGVVEGSRQKHKRAVGTPGNPVTGISCGRDCSDRDVLADGTTRDWTLPAGGGGADQVARDAAEAAQTSCGRGTGYGRTERRHSRR